MYVNDRTIEALFMEPGFKDNPPGVPLDVSSAENMLRHLQTL
jgi:peroxiredoxin